MEEFGNAFEGKTCRDVMKAGMGWRIAVSISSVFLWLAAGIIWLFFYASDFSIYQNIAAFVVSAILFVGVNAATWASFGMRYADHEREKHRHGRSDIISGVGVAVWGLFAIIWLLVYADGYTAYQNLAVFFASILIVGGLSAAAHALQRRHD